MSQGLLIERSALEALAALLLERAGLKITPDGYYGLRLALAARMPALQLNDGDAYIARLQGLAGEEELRALLPLVTVGKTEFFRDSRQMKAFQHDILPSMLVRARKEMRPLKVWCAGCATGEEPYSVAMAAAEEGAVANELDVWASDINPVAVETAGMGRYPVRRVVGVSEERLARFFKRRDEAFIVNADLRAPVRFSTHNLAQPVWPEVPLESIDLIFCRNVIIYFDVPTIIGVMERFHDSLRPGGWLLLGYSESLFKVPSRFEMVEVGGIFAYRRAVGPRRPMRSLEEMMQRVAPPPLSASLPVAPPRLSAPPPLPKPLPAVPTPKTLPVMPPRRPAPPVALGGEQPHSGQTLLYLPAIGSVPQESPVERLAKIIAAIEAGDFPKALRMATLLCDEVPDDLGGRLTLGNVYALMGNLDEAREAYAEALRREPLCVEARVYLALAAMQGHQLSEASVELKRALFLEPTLAVGHYLLGQVHEKQGDAESARRSYRNAVAQRRAPAHPFVGHFPDLPRSNEGVAQAAQYRGAALSER